VEGVDVQAGGHRMSGGGGIRESAPGRLRETPSGALARSSPWVFRAMPKVLGASARKERETWHQSGPMHARGGSGAWAWPSAAPLKPHTRGRCCPGSPLRVAYARQSDRVLMSFSAPPCPPPCRLRSPWSAGDVPAAARAAAAGFSRGLLARARQGRAAPGGRELFRSALQRLLLILVLLLFCWVLLLPFSPSLLPSRALLVCHARSPVLEGARHCTPQGCADSVPPSAHWPTCGPGLGG